MKIIYNMDSNAFGDYDNSIIVVVPDEVEDIEEYLQDTTIDMMESDSIIGFDQAVGIIRKAIPAATGVHPSMARAIVEQVVEALEGALA